MKTNSLEKLLQRTEDDVQRLKAFAVRYNLSQDKAADLRKLIAVVRRQREALDRISQMKFPEDDWDEPGLEAVGIARSATRDARAIARGKKK